MINARTPTAATIDDLMNLVALVRDPETAQATLAELKDEAARVQAIVDQNNEILVQLQQLKPNAVAEAEAAADAVKKTADKWAVNCRSAATDDATRIVQNAQRDAAAIREAAKADKRAVEQQRDAAANERDRASAARAALAEEVEKLEARLAAAEQIAAAARAKALE